MKLSLFYWVYSICIYLHPPKKQQRTMFFLCQLHPSHERIASTSWFCVRNLRCTGPGDGSWDHMLIERLIFPINPVWLMVRKSGINSPVEGKVVEIPLFAKVLYISGGCLGFLNHQQYQFGSCQNTWFTVDCFCLSA